ncbi:BGTF surface domain-containing protein [Halobellus sp. GM3]|uniref:BGTF surface domain-containing protein n=1 Tax=Halobellus sp. GM3 TaxID=3458410 RepID=UPI00403DA808
MRSRLSRLLLAAAVLTAALAPAVLATPAAADQSVDIDYDGERVTVANGSSQVVRGTADARVGTEIVLRVRSAGDTEPVFLKTATGVVTENGTWAASFDFSSQSAGDTFTLRARTENGSAEANAEGEVVACGGDCADATPSGTPTPIPEQTPTPTRTDESTAPVAFGENIFLVDRGGVAAIPIAFEGGGDDDGTDAAVVVIGNESTSNYELEAVVRDDDGDGEAVLYVDTSIAGRGDDPLSVSGGDSVRVEAETSLDAMLDPADYDVSLYAGDERSGAPVDVGSLVIQTANTRTVTETGTGTTPAGSGTGASDGGLGSLAIGGVVSGVFLVGGAALAALLLKD